MIIHIYIYICTQRERDVCIYIYIYISIVAGLFSISSSSFLRKGGMMRLEALVELEFLIFLCFSISNCSTRVVRAYPLVEIRQTAPCRAVRGKSSDSSRQYLSQQYRPPPLNRRHLSCLSRSVAGPFPTASLASPTGLLAYT